MVCVKEAEREHAPAIGHLVVHGCRCSWRLRRPPRWRGAARAAPAEARRLPLRAGDAVRGGAVGRCSGGGAVRVRHERHSSLLVAEGRALRCAALRAVCGAVRRTRDSTITAAIGMTMLARSRLAAGGASARSHLQLALSAATACCASASVMGKGKCERIVFVVSDVMTEVEYHMASSSPIFTARTDGALHGRSYGNVSCGGSGTKTVRPPFMERALCLWQAEVAHDSVEEASCWPTVEGAQ